MAVSGIRKSVEMASRFFEMYNGTIASFPLSSLVASCTFSIGATREIFLRTRVERNTAR